MGVRELVREASVDREVAGCRRLDHKVSDAVARDCFSGEAAGPRDANRTGVFLEASVNW